MEDEEEEDSNIRRGQRRVVPLRRGTSGAPPSRLRGRMSHPLGPPRRATPTFQDRRANGTSTVTRRDYSNHDNRHDDRFENHRKGVIRGASRGGVPSGSGRGFSRGGAPRGARFQGARRTDTSEQSEGYQRGSGEFGGAHLQFMEFNGAHLQIQTFFVILKPENQ